MISPGAGWEVWFSKPTRQLHVAERDPAALAAPAAVDQLRAQRQQLADRRARFGCLRLPSGSKVQIAHSDRQVCHGAQRSEARRLRQSERTKRSRIWTTSRRSRPHVLDTESGRPASDAVEVSLFRHDRGRRDSRSADATTDARRAAMRPPAGNRARGGEYASSSRSTGLLSARSRSRSASTTPTRSYHVPLLMAPYSIASYRGS